MKELQDNEVLDCAIKALKITESFFDAKFSIKSGDGKSFDIHVYKFTAYPKQVLTSPLYNGLFNSIFRYLVRVRSNE